MGFLRQTFYTYKNTQETWHMMSEEASIGSHRLIIRYTWHLQGPRNRLWKIRKRPELFWDVTRYMLVVGTDVGSLTNYQSMPCQIPKEPRPRNFRAEEACNLAKIWAPRKCEVKWKFPKIWVLLWWFLCNPQVCLSEGHSVPQSCVQKSFASHSRAQPSSFYEWIYLRKIGIERSCNLLVI